MSDPIDGVLRIIRAQTGCFVCRYCLPMKFGGEINADWCDVHKVEVPNVSTGMNAGIDCDEWSPEFGRVGEWIDDLDSLGEVVDALESAVKELREEIEEEGTADG